jgi:hypothetical protein
MFNPLIVAQVSSPSPTAQDSGNSVFGLPLNALIDLVKLGEFGCAVAMLVLGFYLYWKAANSQLPDIPARKSVARQFMLFALILFLVCCAVELAKPLMPEPHPKVHAMITVPPLRDESYEKYGKINILSTGSPDQEPDAKHAKGSPQFFLVHENSVITIDLGGLTAAFDDAKRRLDDDIAKNAHAGPAEPK